MGICDSPKKVQNIPMIEENNSPISEISQKQEDENSNNIDTHPTSNSQIENKEKESSEPEIENNKPDLVKYERSAFQSKRSEYSNLTKTQSLFSTITEEEVIIKGEINKNCQNKEEDFDNKSFKDLVKNNGGIIIKKVNRKKSICSNKDINHLKYGNETISEIKSKHTFPFRTINGHKNNLRASGSSLELIQNTMNENNNFNIRNKNIDLLYQNLRNSTKIDVSMQENNQYLNIPKIDEPLPDLDELSNGNPFTSGRNSLISESN